MRTLREAHISGFKSIKSAEISFNDLNIVIGANGSGKSNLISAFRFVERVASHNLQVHVASDPDRFLHHGRRATASLSMDFIFERNHYGLTLQAAQDSLIFENERVAYVDYGYEEPIALGHKESVLEEKAKSHKNKIPRYVLPLVKGMVVYHFHDTSDESPAKKTVDIGDNRFFRNNAGNLAAYLYFLKQKHPVQFNQIEEHIRLVAPFFDRFILEPSRLNESKIKLEWRQKGSDAYFDAYSLSDGTLRFICLATLLLQPNPPALILLDEPELGLHPFAIGVLAEMMQAAARKSQLLAATQSVTLLNHFSLKDILIAEHDGMATNFRRPEEEDLKTWLDEFSLGELWEKNLLGGRP